MYIFLLIIIIISFTVRLFEMYMNVYIKSIHNNIFYSILVQCDNISIPEHGNVSIQTNGTVSVAKVTCDTGFTLSEGVHHTIACSSSGSWDIQQPTCGRYKCEKNSFVKLFNSIFTKTDIAILS